LRARRRVPGGPARHRRPHSRDQEEAHRRCPGGRTSLTEVFGAGPVIAASVVGDVGPRADLDLRWAVTANLQPEPIGVEVWRNLPEEFCRQVELVNGQAVRCEKPSRAHQAAAARVAAMLDAAAEAHMERNPGTCLDTSSDFDVLLWEVPAATIHSPDAALFDYAPNDARPLPAHLVKVIVEVVSPGSRKADQLDKMAEYADAGIPFYWLVWLVWLSGDHVLSIDVHVLDHTLGYYRLSGR
jgi:Uma2 family endonuclease